jgi:hypothetical protein
MVHAGMRLAALAGLLVASPLGVQAATAAGPPNPAQNIPMGALPSSCSQSPLSATCENAVVTYLDDAHEDMGLSPYYLPSGFPSLSPDRQVLILSNLDRVAYGLPPVGGLDEALDASASEGVDADSDPLPPEKLTPGGPVYGWASNWAGGFVNVLAAYYAWMYDDGYGSPNGDCTEPGARGCWGHRRDVLADFGPDGFVSMGVAAGADGSGWPSYAQTLVFTLQLPTYYYTWGDALAEGAGREPSEHEHESEPPGEHEHKTEPPPTHEPESPPPGGQKEQESPAPGGQREPEAKTPSGESGTSSGSTPCTSACSGSGSGSSSGSGSGSNSGSGSGSGSGSPACTSPCSSSGPVGPALSPTTGILTAAVHRETGRRRLCRKASHRLRQGQLRRRRHARCEPTRPARPRRRTRRR